MINFYGKLWSNSGLPSFQCLDSFWNRIFDYHHTAIVSAIVFDDLPANQHYRHKRPQSDCSLRSLHTRYQALSPSPRAGPTRCHMNRLRQRSTEPISTTFPPPLLSSCHCSRSNPWFYFPITENGDPVQIEHFSSGLGDIFSLLMLMTTMISSSGIKIIRT